jgi:signal transduction histidine kinase
MNPPPDSATAPSIRQRLTLTALLAVTVGALLGAFAAAFAVHEQVRQLMESALEETAQALVGLAHDEDELLEIARGRTLPAPPHEERLQWQLRGSDGMMLAHSHQAPSVPWPTPLVVGHTRIFGMAIYTMSGNDIWVHVAEPLDRLRKAQLDAAVRTAAVVLACGGLAALWLALLVRRELQPLAQVAHDVQAMQPGSLGPPPARSRRLELEPVYAALADLQHRLAEQLSAEKAFSEHAAHSLRTPLAGLVAQLEVALASAPESQERRLTLALEAARRLNGVIAALLAMGRAAAPVRSRRFAPAELASVLAGRQIAVDASGLERAPAFTGDVDLLSVALANLVDNAVRHGARAVRVDAAIVDQQHELRVADDGPGVAAEQLARLRSAMAQGSGAGLGLGLALAAAVARSHGGVLLLDSPPAGQVRGFRAQLRWPAASSE